MRKRWPWQRVQAATAAVTEAISSLSPALLARLGRLRFLVEGSDAAKREISLDVKLYSCFLGRKSAVRRNREIGGFTGPSYYARTAYCLLAFWSWSAWQGDRKSNVVAQDNVPSRDRGPHQS